MNHLSALPISRPRSSSSPDLVSSVRPLRRSDPPPRPAGERAELLDQIVRGLSQSPKRLPTRALFDAAGARLFACLATTNEHPLLRCEHAVLAAHAAEIRAELGTPTQLAVAHRVLGADVHAARALALGDVPVVTLDDSSVVAPGAAIFLGGSILGELEPREARARLAKLAGAAGFDGRLVVGIDLRKDAQAHEAAYADASGIAASFTKNVLARINRELGASFDLAGFEHRAVYDAERGRVELQLVSTRWQWVAVGGRWFNLGAGEAITTMVATKYTVAWFSALAAATGWSMRRVFLDPTGGYAIVVLGA